MPQLVSYLMASHYCQIYKASCPSWYLISWPAITVRFTRHDAPAGILSHGQPLLSDLQGMMSKLISYLMASHYLLTHPVDPTMLYLPITWMPTTPTPLPIHLLNSHNPLAEFCVQFWSLFHGQDHLVLSNSI